MTVSITATPAERMTNNPIPSIGAQLRMDGGNYLYITPEVAKQWLPILAEIAGSK